MRRTQTIHDENVDLIVKAINRLGDALFLLAGGVIGISIALWTGLAR